METERDVAVGYRWEGDKIDDESTNVYLLENVGSGHGQIGWYELKSFTRSGGLDMAYKILAKDIWNSLITGTGKMLRLMEGNKDCRIPYFFLKFR